VKDSYLTEDEIATFEEELRQSQLKQEDAESVSDNQAVLVRKAVTKLESIDRNILEKWLHRVPAELLVELVDKSKS
jgi:hypothetical protein